MPSQTTHHPRLSDVLVRLLDQENQLLPFLSATINREVELNSNPSTLFRENTFGTRAMVLIFKLTCTPYLDAIRPSFHDILKLSFTFDATEPGQDQAKRYDANVAEFVAKLDAFLAAIVDNAKLMSPAVKVHSLSYISPFSPFLLSHLSPFLSPSYSPLFFFLFMNRDTSTSSSPLLQLTPSGNLSKACLVNHEEVSRQHLGSLWGLHISSLPESRDHRTRTKPSQRGTCLM